MSIVQEVKPQPDPAPQCQTCGSFACGTFAKILSGWGCCTVVRGEGRRYKLESCNQWHPKKKR